jgi:hypothetical protein
LEARGLLAKVTAAIIGANFDRMDLAINLRRFAMKAKTGLKAGPYGIPGVR